MYPMHRLPFNAWIKKIVSHIDAGKTEYKQTNKRSMCNIMPAFWQKLGVETRQTVCQRINTLVKEGGSGHKVFTNPTHLIGLLVFVH